MSAHAEHEAYLRAALHAAADSLEPRGDGLERIRTRLRQPRPSVLPWAQAVVADLVMRTPAWLQDVIYRIGDWFRLAAERFAPAQAPGKHRSRAQGLLRPVAAMAVVMFIVAAGTYVAIDASTAIFPSSSSGSPSGGGPRTGGHSGAAGPGASHTGGTQSALGTGSQPSSAASCKPSTPKPKGTTAPPPAPASASPTPTPTDTSSSTDTSSPSPGDTSTDSPGVPAATPSAAVPPPATSPSAGLAPKATPTPCASGSHS